MEVVRGEVESVEAGGTSVRLADGRVLAADALVIALGPWSGGLRLVSDVFRVSGIKVHSVVVRPPEPGVISPHALFLSYQTGVGGETVDPEVYPRPSGKKMVRFVDHEFYDNLTLCRDEVLNMVIRMCKPLL